MRPTSWTPSSPPRLRHALGLIAALALLVGAARAQAPPESDPQEAKVAIAESEQTTITAADVLAQVELVRQEIERIRVELALPASQEPRVRVRGATLRECRHHALFLYRRAEQLALELRRLLPPAPALPDAPVDAAQVWTLVDATLDRLADARGALGLRAPIAPVAEVRAVGNDELLMALLEAERAIGELSPEPPSYSEIYLCVSRALGFSSSLRANFPGRRMPPTPWHEASSSHTDIRKSLRSSFVRVAILARLSGLEPLGYVPPADEEDPSLRELRALAELIEAELGVLHARHSDPELLPPVCDPGPRRCSELHKRCGILAFQLLDLERRASEGPDWVLAGSER